ncbi:MAG: DNA methyltransferase [Deltaproteobacteria bacterium]|nr:DNA methyltransferase [Deltaproteobacteria bacterium]
MPPLSHAAKERVGYPTQKPLALLERIITASSDNGQVVLDPFCGCATACIAAEKLGRQWIGIDLSPLAADLVKLRLRKEMGLFYDVRHRLDIPARTDQGKVPNYRTHKHTLYGVQEGLCAGCRIMFPFRNMTVDHVVPQIKGGTDHRNNLQLLCGACNSRKGTKSQEEFIAGLIRDGLRQGARP